MKTSLNLLLAGLVLPLSLVAADSSWTAGSGTFSDPANWNNGVPGAADLATFGLSADTTITLTGNQQILRPSFTFTEPVELTFALGGNTLSAMTTSGSFGAEFGIYLAGSPASNPKTLAIENGVYELQRFGVGPVNAQPGILRLRNGGVLDTALVTDIAQNSTIGNTGRGEVYIDAGSSLITRGNVTVANSGPSASANVVISGAGATWNANHNSSTVQLGVGAPMEMTISNGGSFSGHTVQTQTWTGSSFVTDIAVRDSGSSFTATTFRIGGTGGTSSTTVLVEDGATMSVGALTVTSLGQLQISNSTVTLTGNSVFQGNSDLAIWLHGTGQPVAIDAAQGLTITNSVLSLELAAGFSMPVDGVITLANYSTLTGTFLDLPNLSQIQVGAYTFELDYNYLAGDQIALTAVAIPEVTTVGLLMGGGAFLLVGLRRWRRKGPSA